MTSFDFLRGLRHTGPWVLSSIHPETGAIRTKACMSQENVHEFLTVNFDCNIYYSLNPVIRPEDKKASRENIAAVEYLHVDIDPRAGETFEDEQKRIKKLVHDLPEGIPVPTGIINSGGGYNLIWKLTRPISIDGDLAAAEEAKLFNLRLESVLGGDNCHNIDRILRLPGTTNFPNAKKRARGREEAKARLVSFQPELMYPLSEFKKAHLVSNVNVPKPKIEISGNIARLTNEQLDELGLDVGIVGLIVNGKDLDNAFKYPSRSECLFAVVCAMVKKGLEDEVIYSIITDPDFGISESVLEKGSSTERYGLHQIQRAREKAINPHLMELNDEYAVIENTGGKVRVVRFLEDAVSKQWKPQRFTFEDFRKTLMHYSIPVQAGEAIRQIPKGDWWLSHPDRRQYEQMVFSPGRDVEGALNLWRGFSCEAKAPAPGQEGKHERWLNHIRENVCRNNKEHYDYLISWMARAVQHPDVPGYAAVVLKGGQGTGKGVVARELGSLFGPHFKHVSDASRITGKHNMHLQDCVLLFPDEAFFAGDKQHNAALKRLITESTLDIEAKYHDAEITPNYLHIIMASNDDWVAPVESDDRRFFILEVGNDKKQNGAYFARIIDDLNNGGRENLLYFLQSRDLSKFDVSIIPQTEALRDQKMRSLSPLQAWWFEKLDRGHILEHEGRWETTIPVDTLMSDYNDYLDNTHRRFTQGETAFGLRKFLEIVMDQFIPRARIPKDGVLVISRGEAVTKKRPYAFTFPDLKDCRKAWDKVTRTDTPWDGQ
mgnify:CR=1 FL=1